MLGLQMPPTRTSFPLVLYGNVLKYEVQWQPRFGDL